MSILHIDSKSLENGAMPRVRIEEFKTAVRRALQRAEQTTGLDNRIWTLWLYPEDAGGGQKAICAAIGAGATFGKEHANTPEALEEGLYRRFLGILDAP